MVNTHKTVAWTGLDNSHYDSEGSAAAILCASGAGPRNSD